MDTVQDLNILIANHMDQSIYLTNQEQVLDYATAFTTPSVLSKNADPKPFY
jgi:hypothetical protein